MSGWKALMINQRIVLEIQEKQDWDRRLARKSTALTPRSRPQDTVSPATFPSSVLTAHKWQVKMKTTSSEAMPTSR